MIKYIYLIQQINTNNFKVGYSNNPSKRVKQLQTGSNIQLRLIIAIPTNLYIMTEKHLHEYLGFKYHQFNEWFVIPKNDIESVIKYICNSIKNGDIYYNKYLNKEVIYE